MTQPSVIVFRNKGAQTKTEKYQLYFFATTTKKKN